MKVKIALFVALVLSLFATSVRAADYPTGITPYIFQQAYGADYARITSLLTNPNVGYKLVGRYDDPIGYHAIYARNATVSVNAEGEWTPKTTSRYSSVIVIGTTVGQDNYGEIHFFTDAGVKAFIQVLKKAGYRKTGSDWERNDFYFRQEGRKFWVSDGYRSH